MKLKRILSIITALTIALTICGCKSNSTTENNSSEPEKTIYGNDNEYTSSDAEIDKQKQTTVNLSKTISNSEYCDMEYTINIPNWEYESDYIIPQTKYDSYTRIYASEDENFKFFITEYTANFRYIADKNKSFGSNTYAEALGLSILPTNVTEGYLDEYDDYVILSKKPDVIDGNRSYYEFCLQYPYSEGFKYTKGYILVGVRRPIVVYFFDGTKDTIYDEDMMNKSLEIIKSVKITNPKDEASYDEYEEFDENIIYD